VSDDPELDKLAANRATIWECTEAEARQRLLDEAAAERWTQEAADLAQIEADAGVHDVQVVSGDPPVAIVSSLEIARQGTLSADYYVHRLPGEDAPTFRRRRQAEDAIRRAEGHERHAARLREEASDLAGVMAEQRASDYQRGRDDMLRELAVMDPAERAEVLSRRRHPSGGDTPP
jgi:hypothetical protein